MPKRFRSQITKQVRIIRKALTAIDRSLRRLVALRQDHAAGSIPPKRKLRLSAQRRAALKLQGQYMGYLRNVKPKQKAKVKALRAKKGFGQAIAMAKRLGKRQR